MGAAGVTAPAVDGVLRDRVALVTGAGSGMGRAAALLFARAGAKVVVADLLAPPAQDTAQAIRLAGGEASALQCDIASEDQVRALVAHAVRTYGRLDCAFNNAGIPSSEKQVQEYSLNAWNRALSVNLTGTWLCMKYEIEQMLAQGGPASIVNNASAWAMVGWPGAAPYVAAKHGVVGLTKSAALDHAGNGIRVNAVCPGLIETGMTVGLLPQARASAVAAQPLQRMGQPQEVAQAALWLCSDASSFVTGTTLVVDGGWTT